MYARFINNFETTTTTAITGGVTTSVTVYLDSGDPTQAAVYNVADFARGEHLLLTLSDGVNTAVVSAIGATLVNATTGTLTLAAAPAASYAAGSSLSLRIPKEVLDSYVQQYVVGGNVSPSAVPHGSAGKHDVLTATEFVIDLDAAGESLRLFLLDTGTLDNSLTPTVTFVPSNPALARIVWPDDAAPAFGVGAGLLDIQFFYSPMSVTPAVGDPKEIIFGTWTKSTSLYGGGGGGGA